MSRSTEAQVRRKNRCRPEGVLKRWDARRRADMVLRLVLGADIGEVSRDRKRATLTPILGVAMLAVTSGCSLLLVEGPSNPAFRMPDDPVYCTEASILPAIDAVAATMNLAGAALVAADNSGTFTTEERNVVIGSGILWGVIQAVSWHEGRQRVRECREAKLEWVRAREGTGPQPVSSPPVFREKAQQSSIPNFEQGSPCAWTDTYAVQTPTGWHVGRSALGMQEPLEPTYRFPWQVMPTLELVRRYSHLYRAETGENRFLVADLLAWLGLCVS